ncbi:germinal-center associated nuclear protein isoform X2 [Onthophagus taurus]|uniref:germinal-center associated nuclear protein isoform X2 n=1 Tax=Onthophagus taurus TaxID=166361 RepID=UPI0039BDCB84
MRMSSVPQTLYKGLLIIYYLTDNQIISWNNTYDFIVDRLLAVRQDIVIQDISRSYTISLLQPIVKFYAYSAYRLCESPISDFDPVLNKKNLQECLKKLLLIYDDFDYLQSKIGVLKDFCYNQEEFEILFSDCRQFFEALYILFNLGDTHCIYRGLKLEKKWRTNLVQNSIKMSLCYKNGNWIRLCRMMVKLPPLLAGIASLHLPEIRRKTLEKMSIAFSSKNLSYPIETLQKELLYGTKNELIFDCDRYGIKCSQSEINFIKTDFDKFSKLVSTRKEKFVIDKFIDVKPSFVLKSNTF